MTFFIILVLIIAVLFLVLNFALAPHNPYQEKYSIFECGFHSFLGQNRTQFGIKFFIFGLVYLLLDLEIISVYPYGVSEYDNGIYGLAIVLIFTAVVTIGFVFELSKNALKIDSRQTITNLKKSNTYLDSFSEK
jgi:NADH-ubiquinone oxidoreductase chain 3